MTSVLEVNNISKSFKNYSSEYKRILSWFGFGFKPKEEHFVLKNINFSVSKGESIGIVGKNGAGKSTLLKIITGVLRSNSGTVMVNGRIGAILELGMGFHNDLTGRQNAYHLGGLMGYSQNEIFNVINDIYIFADIGEYFDQPVRVYSSGMKARVSFAVATAFRPEILIVDEALSVGDALFQAKCYARIAKYKEQGTVLFLVTHSIHDIVKHCTRALFIKDGQIELDGSPKEISNRYMDELFGKSNQEKFTRINESSLIIPKDMISGSDDLYNTRFGYNKEEYKWGNGGVKILDYIVYAHGQKYPSVIESSALTEFHFKVLFENNYDDLTVGFLIKTHDGIFLYGTNSFIASEGKEQISVKADSIKFFKFTLPMSLNSGYYLISVGISTGAQENLVPLERRYDSILINISKSVNFSGIVDLHANFTMEDDK